MTGIVSYGVYVPRYRLSRNTIFNAVGFAGAAPLPGEKAVADLDEDSITMAVAAAKNCVAGVSGEQVGGLLFSTTTAPYVLRQNAAIVSAALGLPAAASTADITGCTKSGTAALIGGISLVEGGKAQKCLVCAADCRTAKPGSPVEHVYGDGAAAFLLGTEDVVATIEGSYSVTYDFPGRWQSADERYEHSWEDRFIREEGYVRFIPEAISGLIANAGIDIAEVDKLVYPGPYPREHANIAKRLGVDQSKLQNPLLEAVGDTGCASPLVLLAAALDEAKAGDRIVVASHGSGSDALLLRVTERIEEAKKRQVVKTQLEERRELTSYEKYVAFRSAMPIDVGIRGESRPPTPMSALFRERKRVLELCGSRCQQCGTPQYPPNRICVNPDCLAIDSMEDYRFSDRKAVVFSYTCDNLAASVSPPAIYGLIDFEGGGRYWFDFADCDPDAVEVGMPVRMAFRRKYADEMRGIHAYFWKATPAMA